MRTLKGGGVAAAKWSKALVLREKINENQKTPVSPSGCEIFKKTRTPRSGDGMRIAGLSSKAS